MLIAVHREDGPALVTHRFATWGLLSNDILHLGGRGVMLGHCSTNLPKVHVSVDTAWSNERLLLAVF